MKINTNWLMNNAIFNDAFAYDSVEEMWNCKVEELSDTFIRSVEQHGIVATIAYDHDTKTVYDGHHRLLIAYLLDIEFVEVNDDDFLMENGPDEMERKGFPTCDE